MKVTLKTPFESIQDINDFELPDFTVLTGLNGSGKTQLLRGLQSGHLEAEGYTKDRIISFDSSNFLLDDESSAEIDPRTDPKDTVWQALNEGRQSYRHKAKEIRNDLSTSYLQAVEASKKLGKPLWNLSPNDLPDEVYADLERYRERIEELFRAQSTRTAQIYASILLAAKRLPVGIDEVSHEDFMQVYTPIARKNGLLSSHIGETFADYQTKIERNIFYGYRKRVRGENFPVYSDKEFENRFGPKPWSILNEIIRQVGGIR